MGTVKMTQAELIKHIKSKLPYPGQAHTWDLRTENEVRFTWRGERFRVTTKCYVNTVRDIFVEGSNIAIILERLLGGDRLADAEDASPEAQLNKTGERD